MQFQEICAGGQFASECFDRRRQTGIFGTNFYIFFGHFLYLLTLFWDTCWDTNFGQFASECFDTRAPNWNETITCWWLKAGNTHLVRDWIYNSETSRLAQVVTRWEPGCPQLVWRPTNTAFVLHECWKQPILLWDNQFMELLSRMLQKSQPTHFDIWGPNDGPNLIMRTSCN